MIESTRRYFCDACGREIKGYVGSISVIEIDDDGYPQSVGYDFCEECMRSFVCWKASRKSEAPV